MEHELKTYIKKAASGSVTLREAVKACERFIILEALKANEGDKEHVAKLLQISISSLYRKIGEEPTEYASGNLNPEMEYE